jgi:hypothetical protein
MKRQGWEPGRACAVAFGLGVIGLLPAASVGSGPDVVLSDIHSTTNFGIQGGIRAYSIGTQTCNIGDANLMWSSQGTPAMAMNMYRLHDGRLMQIGLGWCKHASSANAQQGLCGTCNGEDGSVLGVGCMDVYGAMYNGGQARMGPRSGIDPYTGSFSPLPGGFTFAPIERRLQVAQVNLMESAFPSALYFVEGVYVATDDAAAGNGFNNATFKRVGVEPGTYNLTLEGSAVHRPAIFAWRDAAEDLDGSDPDVTINTVDIPGEGRIFVGCRVIHLGTGMWRYEYAVYNLSSEKAIGAFSIPLWAGVTVSAPGSSAPVYHSGEGVSNAPWTVESDACSIRWRPLEGYDENPAANAVRWGTMHNFWFTSSSPPAEVEVSMGSFKPHVPGSVTTILPGPGGGSWCAGDFNRDGSLDPDDLADFIVCFFGAGCSCADLDGNGQVDPDDLSDAVTRFFVAVQGGC